MNESFTCIINKAVAGDTQAIETIIHIYKNLIDQNCFVNGKFDEDCRQYIYMRLIADLKTFGKKVKNNM